MNEPGGNIGGPLFIPHVYNDNKTRTFFFWNEEWRRLIQGSLALGHQCHSGATTSRPLALIWPILLPPARLRLFRLRLIRPSWLFTPPMDCTPGQPFPGNVIPANLIDQNAVLQLNAGVFPKPNFNNGTQYIASIPQPTQVREDVVRIDHTINSKFQLMGHYLHDTMAQNYFPPLWGDSSYPTVGTA